MSWKDEIRSLKLPGATVPCRVAAPAGSVAGGSPDASGQGEDGAGEVVAVAGEGQHLAGGAVVGEDEVAGLAAVGVHPCWRRTPQGPA